MGAMKIAGIITGSVSLGVLILAILLMLVLPGFWLSPIDASEFDDWVADAKSGDITYVTGEIEVKNETSLPLVGSIYQYKFKDANTLVLSSKDIGDKGDNAFVEIEIRELGPEVCAEPSWIIVTGPNYCCSLVTIIGVIIGLILLLSPFLLMTRFKDKKLGFAYILSFLLAFHLFLAIFGYL